MEPTRKTTGTGIVSALAQITAGIQEIPIDEVHPNPINPKGRTTDKTALEQLANSIRELGIIVPLTVVRSKGDFQLIAGDRRLAAARIAGLTTVPVVIRDDLRDRGDEVMLAENGVRLDLTPMEEAIAYQRLMDKGVSQSTIARSAGRTQGHVSQRLVLLTLPTEVQELIQTGDISPWDAYQSRNESSEILETAAAAVRSGTGALSFTDHVRSEHNRILAAAERKAQDLDNDPEAVHTKVKPTTSQHVPSPPETTLADGAGKKRRTCLKKLAAMNPSTEQWETLIALFIMGGFKAPTNHDIPAQPGISKRDLTWRLVLYAAEDQLKTPTPWGSSTAFPKKLPEFVQYYYELLITVVRYRPRPDEQATLNQYPPIEKDSKS